MAQKEKIYIPTYISSVNYEPARILPRILFYNGVKNTDTYYINSNGTSYAQGTFPYFDNYSGNNPTSSSLSLLFFNEPAVYGTTPSSSLYTEYWEDYVELLYNPKTRLLNASAIIPLADYFKMELNDIVEFRGNRYHLRAINDYNLKNGECQIQLLGPIRNIDVLNIVPTIEFCMGYSTGSCALACADSVNCFPTTTTTSTTSTSTSTTSTTTIAPSGSVLINYLVVAGGGASGDGAGKAGGAGGLLSGSLTITYPTSLTIKVGNGGAVPFTNGETSSISFASASIAIGGGAGGNISGSNGGSGGGGGFVAGLGIVGQGNDGGRNGFANEGAPGGGGASSKGVSPFEVPLPLNYGAAGGSGSQWLDGLWYAGGGGGAGAFDLPGGLGGIGGGGNGGNEFNAPTGSAGTPNTGGGGGGDFTGRAGGSGIVKIRYFGSGSLFTGGTISYSGSYTYHTFTASGTFI